MFHNNEFRSRILNHVAFDVRLRLDTSWSLWCLVSWVGRKNNQFEFIVTFVCDASPGLRRFLRHRFEVVFSSLGSISIWDMSLLLCDDGAPSELDVYLRFLVVPRRIQFRADDFDGKACKTKYKRNGTANETLFPDIRCSFSSDAIELMSSGKTFSYEVLRSLAKPSTLFKHWIMPSMLLIIEKPPRVLFNHKWPSRLLPVLSQDGLEN